MPLAACRKTKTLEHPCSVFSNGTDEEGGGGGGGEVGVGGPHEFLCGREVGGWVSEKEAIRTSYCTPWVGGRRQKKGLTHPPTHPPYLQATQRRGNVKVIGKSSPNLRLSLWVGGWVGGWDRGGERWVGGLSRGERGGSNELL